MASTRFTKIGGSYIEVLITENLTKTHVINTGIPPAQLTNVTIGTAVTSIGDNAFEGYGALSLATIGINVTSLGDSAFESCNSLVHVIIPNNVTHVYIDAFRNCLGLKSVIIGTSTTHINNSVFNGCEILESITFPNSVTYIGDNVFRNCYRLDNMNFNGPLTNAEIGNTIFLNILPNNTRTFRFNTDDSTQINPSLLDQIKLITVNDTVSIVGPQIFILPPPTTDISNGTQLLNFLTTDAEYGNINNNTIIVTENLINTSNILKILMNNTIALISITKN
jgi:hypothetical protein